MAQRGASAAVLTELAKSANQPIHLVQVQLDAGDGGTVYMTDAYRSISWGGNTYQALGHFLGFDGLAEASELRTTQARVTLSGVDQVWISNLLSKQYLGRTLIVYKGFLDSNEALLVDPIAILQGPMDAPAIDDDPDSGKSLITVAVTSLGADFDSPAGRHTNVAEQQALFAGDTGFKFCAQIAGQINGYQAYWGRPGSGLAAAAPSADAQPIEQFYAGA